MTDNILNINSDTASMVVAEIPENSMTLELTVPSVNPPEDPVDMQLKLDKLEQDISKFVSGFPTDLENMPKATLKKLRADLNFVLNTLNKGRIEMKKNWEGPIKKIENRIKSINFIVEALKDKYDERIHAVEDEEKTKKSEILEDYYKETQPLLSQVVLYQQLIDDNEEWLNSSFDLRKAKEEIDQKSELLTTSIRIIHASNMDVTSQMVLYYNLIESLDLTKAREALKKFQAFMDDITINAINQINDED